MTESGDAQALAWLKQRDSRGFDWAYARYADGIFGFLVRLTRSRALAEDLFQHTFLRLAERGPSLRLDSDLRAWLFSVARNACHSEARARGVALRAGEGLLTPSTTAASPDSGLALSDLERALERLEHDDRELLLLIGVEGLDHAQLSTILGVDSVTVRKRVSRARERFAHALDAEGALMQTTQWNRSP
jgi:RNA polymerase sigma-70 factor (ECF subfamily)